MKTRPDVPATMTNDWPRNIVPHDERSLRALSSVASYALYEAALDKPLLEADLTKDEEAIVHDLVAAGLLRRAEGRLFPTHRHRRDAAPGIPGRMEHKLAKVGYAQAIVGGTLIGLERRGPDALAAVGVVTLPETPEMVARAVAIMAEAEDQLRALAEEAPDVKTRFRVVVFAGSTP